MGRRRSRRNREQRRRETQAAAGSLGPLTASAPRRRTGFVRTIDSFGGPVVVGGVFAAVVAVVAIIVMNPFQSVSDDPLLGEEAPITSSQHVQDPVQLQIPDGRPPAGGPHYPEWARTGIYPDGLEDGYAIHALEHGVVWISYNPDLVSEEQLAELEDVANDFDNDVILSSRPENASAVAMVSWGRIMELDAPDREVMEDFIRTNRNRSPEPGVRGGGIMP